MEYMIKRCSRSLAKYINKNRDYEISILSKLLSIIIAFLGIGLFLHGFLLNRTELYNETNEKLKLSLKNPLTVARNGRIILLLVDALGYALIQNNNENNQFLPDHISPHSQNQSRPQLNSLSKAAYIGKFIADPPTTTLQRLKALMTGSMPTFIDAGSNFGGNKVLEDNLLKQWNKAGKQIRFVGDETWIDLFPDCFSHYKAYSSFNVKDLDTVDRGVENYFLHALNSTSLDWNNEVVDNKTPQTHWDILIGHMLGIDHCGHTYGPAHPEMMRKLNELNSFIELIVSKLQSSDILFILGDHGMTRSGDHGGDSDAELEAAFIVFTADKDSLIIKDDSENQTNRRLCQIDLVPTLSLLTNVPIPYSNLGILYDHLLGHGANVHQGMVLNFIQMFTYTANYYYNISKLPLSPILISYMDRIMLSSTYDWIEQLNDIHLNPIGLKFLRICSSLPCLPFMTLLYLSIMLLFRLFIRQFLICREELSNSSLCRSILDPWLTKSLNRLNPIHEFYPIGGIRVMFAILMLIIYLRLYWRLLSEYQNISMSLNQSNKANWKKLSLFILIDSLLLHVPQKCISWILAIFLCLLDNLSFFITGHQPTLSGIPWDAAYAAYEGDHNTRWLPGLTVLLHLYSGPIIIAFSLPTIIILSSRLQYVHGTVIHSHSNKSRNTSFYRFVDALDLFIWRFIISKSVLTLGCMLSTGLLRRHLMVWKIFAPHLLFSMLSLLISAVCLPLIRFLVVYCLHNRICKILKSHFNIHKCV
ncbi:hypothetical protein Smp_021980 [Schistosoma mansoni]|uniref:hypothetical protein n=1 Tax=Schistosoma mansoni TaxID=6183 RepID=UPI00022DC0B8|nr:hypothetical protein Smp_021980 [Schistosoma mansoni]|eukprot:XP_018649684.1 hypothetical protein Smp_021980 [Schistosoma mansoni]